jgi:hypothetical protein
MEPTLHQYYEMMQVFSQEWDTELDKMIEIIAIVDDKDPYNVGEMAYDDVVIRYIEINQFFSRGFGPSQSEITVDNHQLHKKPFNSLTLGEWIDCENWISSSKNVAYLTAILYRQVERSAFYADIWEPYGNWIDKRINLMNDLPISSVHSIVKEYIEWREGLMTAYSGLFDTIDEWIDPQATEQEKAEAERAYVEDAKARAFIWESVIMDLCNNDITQFNQVTDQSLILVLNVLSMKKMKTK